MILVLTEKRDGKFPRLAQELLSEAVRAGHSLNEPVSALLPGPKADESDAKTLGSWGAEKIFNVCDPSLERYHPETHKQMLTDAITRTKPSLILLGATTYGRELTAAVGGALGIAAANDCMRLEVQDKGVAAVRPVYAGKALATVKAQALPFIVSFRPNMCKLEPASPGQQASVEPISVTLSPPDKIKIVKLEPSADSLTNLADARIIVSGGRGLQGPENFPLLEALARSMGAALGASRMVVDSGWIAHKHQVGQTGKTVSPDLYIACGISGAIQHLAGMSNAKCIVAINKDPEAPIFKIADYGIVGDLFEIVPVLTREMKAIFAEKAAI